MKKRILFILILILFGQLLISLGSVEAVEQTEDTVYIKAGHLKYQESKIILTEGVTITKKDNKIESQSGELFKDENKAILTRDVKVNYSQGDVQSAKLTVWLDDEKYVFEDNVLLNHTLEDKQKQLKLQAPYLEMYTATNSFQAQNGVIIDYDQRRLKGEKADYDDQQKLLTLTGNVMIEEDGDWIKSDQARFYLDQDKEEFTADGNVELQLTTNN